MRETGVLTGLFDESELDSNNVKVSFIFPYIKTCFVKLRFIIVCLITTAFF